MAPSSSVSNTAPPTMAYSEVSWPSLYWGLLPLVINSMMQPIGSLSPSITPEQSLYLHSSPLICTLEALSVFIQFMYFTSILRNPVLAARYLAGLRLENSAQEGPAESNLQALRGNSLFRTILFVFGATPQIVKLLACSGIPFEKTWVATFLCSFLTFELLVVLPRHLRDLDEAELNHARTIRLAKLDAWIADFQIGNLQVRASILWICFIVNTIVQTRSPWWRSWIQDLGSDPQLFDLVFPCLLASATILKLAGVKYETTLSRVWEIVARVCLGALHSVWLNALVQNSSKPQLFWVRFLGWVGASLIIDTILPVGKRLPSSPNPRVQKTMAPWFFLLAGTSSLMYYILLYDQTGTRKPAWAEYLG